MSERKAALAAIEEGLCFQGDLRHLTRRHAQRRFYEAVHRYKRERPQDLTPFVLNGHRRIGKSHGGVLLQIERCIRRPGERCRFGAATHSQVEGITADALRAILGHLPTELQPKKRGNEYTFRNPHWTESGVSIFSLHNLESQDAKHLRGLGASCWAIDECRDLEDLPALIRDVVGFHFVDALRDGFDPLLLLFSTPPKSPAHAFTSEFIPKAEAAGTYLKITVEDNEDWSVEDERFLVALCGGKNTISWRREAMCEVNVADDSTLVIPEMSEVSVVVDSFDRPSHYFSFVGADFGWSDHTGGVLAWIDFQSQRLVVEDVFFERYTTLGQLSLIVRALLAEYFPAPAHPTRFVADARPQEVETLRRDFGLPFQAAVRWDKYAGIANLRTALQSGRIAINSRCRALLMQMQYGLWNTQRTDFTRTEAMGHLDCLSALIYLWRMASPYLVKNPFPDGSGWSGAPNASTYVFSGVAARNFIDAAARFPSTRMHRERVMRQRRIGQRRR